MAVVTVLVTVDAAPFTVVVTVCPPPPTVVVLVVPIPSEGAAAYRTPAPMRRPTIRDPIIAEVDAPLFFNVEHAVAGKVF
jgi:hypothetical protein